MARQGGGVTWWRVVRADGSLPPSHDDEARAAYLEEGTPLAAMADKLEQILGRFGVARTTVARAMRERVKARFQHEGIELAVAQRVMWQESAPSAASAEPTEEA